MPVTVELPAALTRYSNDQSALTIDAATVQDALDELWKTFPELRPRVADENGELYPYLLLIHNQQHLPRKHLDNVPLADGDRLEIVALAEGG